MAVPTTTLRINTADIEIALLKITRFAGKAAANVAQVVGRRVVQSGADIGKKLKEISVTTSRLVLDQKRLAQATRIASLPLRGAAKGPAILGIGARIGGPVALAAIGLQIFAGRIRAEKQRADFQRSLFASARLDQLRNGPADNQNTFLRATEASRVRSTRQKATTFEQEIRSPLEAIKAKLGLETPNSIARGLKKKQTLDGIAASLIALGVPPNQLSDRIKFVPTEAIALQIRERVQNANFRGNVAQLFGRIATGTPFESTQASRKSSAEIFSSISNFASRISISGFQPFQDDYPAQIKELADQRHLEVLINSLEVRKKRADLANQLINTPSTGFFFKISRQARDFGQRFSRPRISGMKRD